MRHLIVGLFILFFILPAHADQLIIEPEAGRTPIINAMQSAKKSIDLVMYGFTDDTLLNTLLLQQKKGTALKLILERHPFKTEDENNKTIAQLNAAHIAWLGAIPPLRFIHQKTLLIDDTKAIVMTFNFTHSSFKNERNFGLIIDNPTAVRTIQTVFDADWQHKTIHPSTDYLIYSPNSREQLIALIMRAKQSIKIYSQNVSDYKLIGALAKAAKKGIKVDIITSATLGDKKANYLANAGVKIHQSKHLYIHAKVFIIDQQLAAIGSINLTQTSLDKNRELSVITRDSLVIQQLTSTFAKDLSGTQQTFSATHSSAPNWAAFIPSHRTVSHFLRLIIREMHSHHH